MWWSYCFLPQKGGLFERPRAAFYTMETAGVMRRMTVVMAATTRRKTCFPTGGTAITAKAKPPEATTAFCVCPISHIKSAKRHHQPTHPPPRQMLKADAQDPSSCTSAFSIMTLQHFSYSHISPMRTAITASPPAAEEPKPHGHHLSTTSLPSPV